MARRSLKDAPGKLGEKTSGASRQEPRHQRACRQVPQRRYPPPRSGSPDGRRRPGPGAQRTLDRFHKANLAAHNRIGASKLRAGAGAFLQGFMVVYLSYKDVQDALEEYNQTVASVR